MATISARDVLVDETRRFARYLNALQECSEEVREIVNEMSAIIVSEDSTDDEREHAVDVMLEALFPADVDEMANLHRLALGSKEALAAKRELDAQEQTFADRLRAIIAERGLRQEDLAEMAGVKQPAISRILNRQCRPQQRTIRKLAEALKISPDELWPKLSK